MVREGMHLVSRWLLRAWREAIKQSGVLDGMDLSISLNPVNLSYQ